MGKEGSRAEKQMKTRTSEGLLSKRQTDTYIYILIFMLKKKSLKTNNKAAQQPAN